MRRAIFAVLLLAACSREVPATVAIPTPADFCPPMIDPEVVPDTANFEARINAANGHLTYCINRAAAQLAPAPDSAELVARVVADRCYVPMLVAARVFMDGQHPPLMTLSIATQDLDSQVRREALAAVITARAGHCEAH